MTFRLARLYPILDTALLMARGLAVLPFAEAVLAGGAEILQFRHKGEVTREVFLQAEEVGRMVRAAGAQYVINDRADLAALFDAALHLGQDDLPPAYARRVVGPDRPIGLSTHNADQLRAAAGEAADYLALGPIYATQSKARPDPIVGADGLRACRPLTDRPLVAIGGISLETGADILRAGANSVAVIGALVPPRSSLADVREQVETWRRCLDSAITGLR